MNGGVANTYQNRGAANEERCLHVNWFPMESGNEDWTCALVQNVAGLHACVLAASGSNNLKYIKPLRGTFKENSHDGYYVLRQIKLNLKELFLVEFSKLWDLPEDEFRNAVDFLLQARNAHAHKDREPQDKLHGKMIHNKEAVQKLYVALKLLMVPAVKYAAQFVKPQGQRCEYDAAYHALCEIGSRNDLFKARNAAFYGRKVEKIAAIKQGDLAVKLTHAVPHTDCVTGQISLQTSRRFCSMTVDDVSGR
jgi:hypothetical protein